MKKGISLSIDTTVIIILAVIVLAVLIGLFFLVAGPTRSEIEARLKQMQVCNAYRNFDVDCSISSNEYNEFISNSNNENLMKELGTACNTLKISGCSADTASDTCVRACCPGCGATTTTLAESESELPRTPGERR